MTDEVTTNNAASPRWRWRIAAGVLAAHACTPAFANAVLAGQLPESERRSLLQRALLAVRAPAASALHLYQEP